MMIRILKTSHGHPFYRANRSKNQKLIQGGEKDITDMPKNRAFDVKIPATGRQFRRPVEYLGDRSTKFVFLPLATNCSSLQVPPMTKFSWSNPDSSINQDTSYASAAFMAKGSFCKAGSLSKLGLRPSYAKDIKELFHSYIVSKEIFVDLSTHIADF